MKFEEKIMRRIRVFIGIVLFAAYVPYLYGTGINPEETRKTLTAVKIRIPPKIDGVLDDPAWEQAPVADDFVQYAPYNGKPATFPTQVRVVYDDKALYISAFMYDPHPDSIYRELGKRDADRGIRADNFSVDLNPFHDGVNGESFKVSASGVKTDMKRNPSSRHGRDINWDAVWYSAVKINDNGWTVEMKIPYSALRFPKAGKETTWGINFWREIRRYQEYSSWNMVNREVGNTFNYLGNLSGIHSIDPPLRLSVTPYVSGYLEHASETGSWSNTYNGGLDLRYGINESFTLDMTLIPDFGQVQSDDKILNLSPFEVKYNEKRQFFTEGTELFNKGNIFYSRRVGGKPVERNNVYDKLNPDETIVYNPEETQLINASKISGRNKHGLGIGFFNAVTQNMYARVKNNETGEERRIRTQPVANYNMLVLDQSLKNNSYVSLENTNVYRFADKDLYNYTANVTATDFLFKDKSNMYSIGGQAALSQKYFDSLDTELGHRIAMKAGKTGGAYRVEYSVGIMSDTYDPNDMGYLRHNNEISHELAFSYNMYKPRGILLSSRNELNFEYTGIYNPRAFSEFQFSLQSFTQFKNYWYTAGNLRYAPWGKDDYFEPRVPGRYFHKGPKGDMYLWLMSDRNKPFYFRTRFNASSEFTKYEKRSWGFSVSPNYRVSQRFQLAFDMEYNRKNRDIGYIGRNSENDSVWLGMRNIKTISNTLSTSYIFTRNIYLSFRMRHYWSQVNYTGDSYYLNPDGTLTEIDDKDPGNINYNSFNIDMDFVWRFAPGSEMSMVWKNAIYTYSDRLEKSYLGNVGNVLASPQVNSFSLKILYYLDFQSFRKNRT